MYIHLISILQIKLKENEKWVEKSWKEKNEKKVKRKKWKEENSIKKGINIWKKYDVINISSRPPTRVN